MTDPIRFDDSLPKFAALVEEVLGAEMLTSNIFLRDATGKLTFVMADAPAKALELRATLTTRAVAELGYYVDGDEYAVATPEELFDDRLKVVSNATKIEISHLFFNGTVNLMDRRMVGGDWLRRPLPPPLGRPVRFVFASLKGGVGRSTALCVLATELASKGRRVLAIDMDLEAPGLGNLLLPGDTLPDFGLLDYLVESEVGGNLGDKFYADMVGYSALVGGLGRVDVIPAIGNRSLQNPANVLAKIARAYLATTGEDGDAQTFSDHMHALVEHFSDPLIYDTILIDARAGLHETTASAVIGLGAEVFFFGIDQPQTFTGYELLLAHLGGLDNPDHELQSRLHFVQAKALLDTKRRAGFSERMGSLRDRYFRPHKASMDVEPDALALRDTFEVEWSGDETPAEQILEDFDPPPTLAVFEDDRFRIFDPSWDRTTLASEVYLSPFRELIDAAKEIIESAENAERSL